MTSDSSEGGPSKAEENVVALLPWEGTIRRARMRRSAVELLDRKDADAAIRALSELEVHQLVRELGADGSLPILSVLEPHQLRAIIDLDTWRGDRAGLDDLLVWLAALREASPEQLSAAARAIDPELLQLLLRRRLLIALVPTDDDPEHEIADWLREPPEELLPLVRTPDSRFIIAARAYDEEDDERRNPIDEEDRKLILELVDALYKDQDFELIAAMLRVAEVDLSSALEETAYRFRTARLEDLGFPDRERALSIYAYVDPDSIPVDVAEAHVVAMALPAIHAGRFDRGLLHEVLGASEDPELIRRVEAELVALSNAALVAERVEPGDLVRLRAELDRVRAYLELSLEHGADPARLVESGLARLRRHSLRTLFSAGWSLTVPLRSRAQRLRATGAFRSGDDALALLDESDRAALDALLLRRPELSSALEPAPPAGPEPGAPPEPRPATRPFSSKVDLARAEQRLVELEALAAAAKSLGLPGRDAQVDAGLAPSLPSERTVEMWLVTAVTNVVLGRGFVLDALDRADLALLATRLAQGEEARRVGLRGAREVLGAPAEVLEPRLSRGMSELSEVLAPLAGAPAVDPRFVGVVVRRLSPRV